MNSFGVIIQGPLVSLAGQIPGNPVTRFNNLETILKNTANIARLGGSYVVSTWTAENDEEKTIVEGIKDAHIPLVTHPNNFPGDADHRYKQRFGTMFGLTTLEKTGESPFWVKIRTDMLMPEEFWKWVLEKAASPSNKLGISELTKGMPFFMGDFVYAAKRDVFYDFLKCITDYKYDLLYPTIGIDDGLKYSNHKKYFSFRSYFQKMRIMYLFVFREKLLVRLWNSFITKEFEVMPRDIWTKIIWRGRPMAFFVSPDKFKFDTLPDSLPQSSLGKKWFKFNVLMGNYEICYTKRHNLPFMIKLYGTLKRVKARFSPKKALK
jgi:hypothetical protein